MRDYFKGVGLIVLSLIIAGVLGVGIWGITVALSGPKGTGDIIKQNNSADNRIYTQAFFEDLYGNIQAYSQQLPDAIAAYKKSPNDQVAETNYTGLHMQCLNAVNQYNAASSKTLFRDWKSADLPETINAETACPSAN